MVAASVLFPPAYSPDDNPVEEAISKIKGILESAGGRTRDALRRRYAKRRRRSPPTTPSATSPPQAS